MKVTSNRIRNPCEITISLCEDGKLQGEEITGIWFDEYIEPEKEEFIIHEFDPFPDSRKKK